MGNSLELTSDEVSRDRSAGNVPNGTGLAIDETVSVRHQAEFLSVDDGKEDSDAAHVAAVINSVAFQSRRLAWDPQDHKFVIAVYD